MSPPLFGAGFRSQHYAALARSPRALDWLELVSENFAALGGPRRALLERLRADHPIALHGVSLSIAGCDPLDRAFLRDLRALADQVEALHVSDHLCWTTHGGRTSHDLLPVALTASVLEHVAARVSEVQDALGRRILLENATGYVAFRCDELDEAAFFAELCRRSGCGMLLDVNNLYVNAHNLGVDAERYLAALRCEDVAYLHVAGHAVLADVRIDTHGEAVPDQVWALYDRAVRRFPDAHVVIERDENIPELAELCAEVELARKRHAAALAAGDAAAPVAPAGLTRLAVSHSEDWPALQATFWRRAIEREPDTSDAFAAEDRPVSAARGLRVYSDAFATNLERALAVNFPALARVLDARDFAALAAAYLRAHPPVGHDFRALGRELAAFVRGYAFARDYGVERSALADLAALEQAQLEVQDEIDEGPPLGPDALAALAPEDWEAARFRFVRALRLVRASCDVLPAVEAVARGATPERPAPAPTSYLVFRDDGRLRSERISEREADLAERLIAGRSFAEACEDGDDLAIAAAQLLVNACRRGLVLAD